MRGHHMNFRALPIVLQMSAVLGLIAAPVGAQQTYLKASNTQCGDFFGGSIAVSGDTIAIAATGEDSSAAGVGGDQSVGGLALQGE